MSQGRTRQTERKKRGRVKNCKQAPKVFFFQDGNYYFTSLFSERWETRLDCVQNGQICKSKVSYPSTFYSFELYVHALRKFRTVTSSKRQRTQFQYLNKTFSFPHLFRQRGVKGSKAFSHFKEETFTIKASFHLFHLSFYDLGKSILLCTLIGGKIPFLIAV